MDFIDYFPIWNKLSPPQQQMLSSSLSCHSAEKGTLLHGGAHDCLGLILVRSGQLRAHILSDEGREVTLYRLFPRDMCLFSASCTMQSMQFDISVEAEKDSVFWIIPPETYKKLSEQSIAFANYINQLLADRFSEVMWLIEQVIWKSFDGRLAAFLLDESELEHSHVLKITHEKIANHMGTAREVVTRMLRYFQEEKMVSLSRGSVELTNPEKLQLLAQKSAPRL